MSGPAAEGVREDQLSDDTLVVLLSDAHIGGAAGSDIFESAAELSALLRDLSHHPGPVELVLAGDFLDLLRMGERGDVQDGVSATIARPEYSVAYSSNALLPMPGSPRRTTPPPCPSHARRSSVSIAARFFARPRSMRPSVAARARRLASSLIRMHGSAPNIGA